MKPEGSESNERYQTEVVGLQIDMTSPMFFDVLQGEASSVRDTSFGRVGSVYTDDAIEMVWVSKQAEAIDPGWVRQDAVDLLIVVQGQLKVEFESSLYHEHVMKPGEVLVLPPGIRCRAYRWPREVETATVFIAVYPKSKHEAAWAGHAGVRSVTEAPS